MTFLKDENGQGMVEYALILGLIAVVAIIIIIALGGKVKGMFKKANEKLTTEAE